MNTSRIGPFALEEKLGGKNSSVYRALHLQQRRQVALKVFAIPLAANEHARTEFSDEMDLLKKLHSVHAARCFGGNLDQNHGYVAQELIEGETLAALVAHRTRLSWEQAVDIAEQVAEALQAAHELELTHHDLTPDKVIVRADGSVKVVDFRRQRAKNPFCVSSHRRTAARLAFQAPEQIRNAEQIGPKADLYALGCLLYLMLTGKSFFEAATADEVAQKQLQEIPPRVSSVVLDCPIWLDSLVTQLLEKDPLRRPHSAGAALLALHETKKRMAAGTGVTQHAMGGISALKMEVDKEEVRKLVGRKASGDDSRTSDEPPFYERPWFLTTALALLLAAGISVLAFALWPMGPDKMIAEADRLMSSGDPSRQREAEQSYLRPLVASYPGTDYARRAQEHLDKIEMTQAENRLKTLAKLGRQPKTEAGRLLLEASKYEEFGDRVAALEKYEGIVSLIEPAGDDRLFVMIAKRQIARLEADKSSAAQQGEKLIDAKLAEAEALHAEGKSFEARRILTSIISLYGDNAEYAPLVERVQKKLEELGGRKSREKESTKEKEGSEEEPMKGVE